MPKKDTASAVVGMLSSVGAQTRKPIESPCASRGTRRASNRHSDRRPAGLGKSAPNPSAGRHRDCADSSAHPAAANFHRTTVAGRVAGSQA